MYNRSMTILEWLDKYQFYLKNTELIEEAFTHRSYRHEHQKTVHHDNQRLEFMGDAVIQLWSAEFLFTQYPALDEGEMTKLRAMMVCEDSLAICAKDIELDKVIRLGKGELQDNGNTRASTLADCFEAVIGALYLELGIDKIDPLLKEMFKNPERFTSVKVNQDFKTQLQEYVQADNRRTIEYVLLSTQGPANAREFEMAVKIDDIIYGKGKGSSKKRAEQAAAEVALEKLVK